MEEEIKAEFKKNGFALDDEEEILKKCKLSFISPLNLTQIYSNLTFAQVLPFV